MPEYVEITRPGRGQLPEYVELADVGLRRAAAYATMIEGWYVTPRGERVGRCEIERSRVKTRRAVMSDGVLLPVG